MKKLLILALCLASMPAFPATAFWTGQMEIIQTVTYQVGYRCEYSYAGQNFWLVFTSICPPSTEVQ